MSIIGSIWRLLGSVTRTRGRYSRSAVTPRQDVARASEHEVRAPAHADERTIRRVGEAQLGGTSSEASREAYERGENPGGLHQGGKGPLPIHGDAEDAQRSSSQEDRR